MNSFPRINNDLIIACFNKLKTLYFQDEIKILEAAERATRADRVPFIITSGSIDPQLSVLKNRLNRTADEYGQKLLIKLIEELYDDLVVNGATGVTNADFLTSTGTKFDDESQLKYSTSKQWKVTWELDADGNKRTVEMGVRGKHFAINDIVPDYVLQYVQQGMIAFNNKRYAASLALMTIALEGTLRDALILKGYSYQYGSPTQDVYQLEDIHIHKDISGYKVTFPSTMPLDHTHYLAAQGDPKYKSYKIKRVLKDTNTYLEIRQANDLLDYWSSNIIVTPGTMQISGLGAALNISRNHASFLFQTDLPDDLDAAIQAVRNNLIHLSGNAMSEVVETDSQGQAITLELFLKNKNKVFDAVCTIGDAINKIYERIANGTL
jgi:hypothetical protein